MQKHLVSIGVLVCLAVFGLFSSCKSIDTATVGVVKHFGAAQSEVLHEGINFIRPWPFAEVIPVTIAVSVTETDVHAGSKDLQSVNTKVAVHWVVVGELAPQLVRGFGYGDGAWTNGIMAPAIQETVKAVSARYTAEQLLTHRAQVRAAIQEELDSFVQKTLGEKKMKGAIRVVNIAITNFAFSEDFNKAIEAKVQAEQDALKAVNEKTKRITQAEATFQETKLNSDAVAYKTDVESKARAEAIKREVDALRASPELIQLRVAERWDGKLPTYTGQTIPMIQLPKGP